MEQNFSFKNVRKSKKILTQILNHSESWSAKWFCVLGTQHLRVKDYYFFLHKGYFLKVIYFCVNKGNLGNCYCLNVFSIENKFYLCLSLKLINSFCTEWYLHHFTCKVRLCVTVNSLWFISAGAQRENGTVTNEFKLATNSNFQKLKWETFPWTFLSLHELYICILKKSAAFFFASASVTIKTLTWGSSLGVSRSLVPFRGDAAQLLEGCLPMSNR